MSVRDLRESVQALREFMFGSAYAGPEPGANTWNQNATYPPTFRSDLFGSPEDREAEQRKFRDKAKTKREKLRKISAWVARSK